MMSRPRTPIRRVRPHVEVPAASPGGHVPAAAVPTPVGDVPAVTPKDTPVDVPSAPADAPAATPVGMPAAMPRASFQDLMEAVAELDDAQALLGFWSRGWAYAVAGGDRLRVGLGMGTLSEQRLGQRKARSQSKVLRRMIAGRRLGLGF